MGEHRRIAVKIVDDRGIESLKVVEYDPASKLFELAEGRRPAGYVVATPGSKAFDDPGQFVEIPLVNQIRPRVKAWREAGYPGVTSITKRLLEHWRDPECDQPFFFCQLEAIETLIWLTEAAPADRIGFEIPYLYQGVVRKYRPDFLVRLVSGEMLILETKGEESEQDQVKHRYLDEWIQAVNAHGGFGRWRWAIVRHLVA